MTDLAAAPVFERPRNRRGVERDRRLLTAAAGLDRFTARDVALSARDRSWYGSATILLRTLLAEGHLRVVSAPGAKPYLYEWVDP